MASAASSSRRAFISVAPACAARPRMCVIALAAHARVGRRTGRVRVTDHDAARIDRHHRRRDSAQHRVGPATLVRHAGHHFHLAALAAAAAPRTSRPRRCAARPAPRRVRVRRQRLAPVGFALERIEHFDRACAVDALAGHARLPVAQRSCDAATRSDRCPEPWAIMSTWHSLANMDCGSPGARMEPPGMLLV